MTDYEIRVTALTVGPTVASSFSEAITRVTIDDEGGGEYVCLSQGREDGTVTIDPNEWPTLREAVERLLKECRG